MSLRSFLITAAKCRLIQCTYLGTYRVSLISQLPTDFRGHQVYYLPLEQYP